MIIGGTSSAVAKLISTQVGCEQDEEEDSDDDAKSLLEQFTGTAATIPEQEAAAEEEEEAAAEAAKEAGAWYAVVTLNPVQAAARGTTLLPGAPLGVTIAVPFVYQPESKVGVVSHSITWSAMAARLCFG